MIIINNVQQSNLSGFFITRPLLVVVTVVAGTLADTSELATGPAGTLADTSELATGPAGTLTVADNGEGQL